MHPQWKALATCYIRYQTFVTPGTSNSIPDDENKSVKHDLRNITSEEASSFYKTVTESPSKPEKTQKRVRRTVKRKINRTSIKYSLTDYFKASSENNQTLLKEILQKNPDFINKVDHFNWSALMMSSCSGSCESFLTLLEFGADLQISDKKGETALSLAEKNNHHKILETYKEFERRKTEIIEIEDSDDDEQKVVPVPFHCEICDQNFKETSRTEHMTSVLHQFNLKHHEFPRRFGIPETNRGFQMMLNDGWTRDGLGPNQEGVIYPVKTCLRKFRTGLGIKQSKLPRITHFGPNDTEAIKKPHRVHVKTRKEVARDANKEKQKERKLRKELTFN